MQACPTVFFCVGATKAGTSWLHRYLSDHPDCHMRSIKELHYFDALDGDGLDGQIKNSVAMKAELSGRLKDADSAQRENIFCQIGDREDWLDVLRIGSADASAYLRYLKSKMTVQKLVADMTPAYSLLSESRLKMMAHISPDTRFVYLLRDPVRRLWSHVRMIAARRSEQGSVERHAADRILKRTMKGREAAISARSDYRTAITKLQVAVAPSRLLIAFYEDLFDGEGLRRICEFLGISYVPTSKERKIHAGQPLKLKDEQLRAARVWLEDQYDFVRTSIGGTPPTWQYELAKVKV